MGWRFGDAKREGGSEKDRGVIYEMGFRSGWKDIGIHDKRAATAEEDKM